MDIALSIVQQSLNCQTSIISRFHLIINNPFILHFCNIIIRALNSSLLYGIFGQLSSIPHNKLYKTTAFSILDPAIKTHMHKTRIYLQIHNKSVCQYILPLFNFSFKFVKIYQMTISSNGMYDQKFNRDYIEK